MHDIQNECLEIIAHNITKDFGCSESQYIFFSVIVDEATDISLKEQVSLCLRHVSSDTLESYENFVGLFELD